MELFCIISLMFSFLCLIGSIVIAIVTKSKKKTLLNQQTIAPFQIFFLGFFLAAVVGFYPLYHLDFLKDETGILKIVKSLFLSTQNALRIVALNDDFSFIRSFFENYEMNLILEKIYTIYMAAIYFAAPLLTISVVLSFFQGTTAFIHYNLKPCSELYVFSELNERSLTLAKDILSNSKKRKIVVFANTFEKKEEKGYELILQAKKIGAFCFKKDITHIGLHYAKKNCLRKLYFIAENEDENIQHALTVILEHQDTKYDTSKLQLYVFSKNAESETLLNSAGYKEMKVRRVNEFRNLALEQLRENPIFDHCIEIEGKKQMNIVIIGLGRYGEELLKAICWIGQMPNYTMNVHVFDGKNAEDRLRASVPEFISPESIHDDAQYKIHFHNNIDVKSSRFVTEINNIPDITSVYVTLGVDQLNIETAMQINMLLRRKHFKDFPKIYAVVYNDMKADIGNKGLEYLKNKKYEDITFIGSLHSRYSLKNIEQEELEKKAREIHAFWQDKEAASKIGPREKNESDEDYKKRIQEATKKMKDTIQDFEHFEYNRKSSIAQAVYREMRNHLKLYKMDENTPEGKRNNDMLREYEHRRWNVYMRSEGYISSSTKSHIAKTHDELKPFRDLKKETQEKDDY